MRGDPKLNRGAAQPFCSYEALPPVDTKHEVTTGCNAVYSAAPHPFEGKPCSCGQAYFDKFNNICRRPKPDAHRFTPPY